jgi:Mitochondrial carrier protein
MTTGLGSLIVREYLFSLTFWPVMENTKLFLRDHAGVQNPVVLDCVGGMVGCLISSTISYPADMMKTLRISFEKKYADTSTVNMFKMVYKEGGSKAFLDGKLNS